MNEFNFYKSFHVCTQVWAMATQGRQVLHTPSGWRCTLFATYYYCATAVLSKVSVRKSQPRAFFIATVNVVHRWTVLAHPVHLSLYAMPSGMAWRWSVFSSLLRYLSNRTTAVVVEIEGCVLLRMSLFVLLFLGPGGCGQGGKPLSDT